MHPPVHTIALTDDELFELTQRRQPARQLEVLHAQGYVRAYRVNGTGPVVLPRAHFEAVNRQQAAPANDPAAAGPRWRTA